MTFSVSSASVFPYAPTDIEESEPRARLRGFGASSMGFELLAWAKQPEEDDKLIHERGKKISVRFQTEGVNIPFPQRVVHMVGNSSTSDAEHLDQIEGRIS